MSMPREERARTPYIDYLKPIIADGDTGFGGTTATVKLCKLFVERGAVGVHLEDQSSVTKKSVCRTRKAGKDKLKEVMVGLAAQESSVVFQRAGYGETNLARVLVQILKSYPNPSVRVPSIRRFAIELSIWMMTDKATNVQVFRFLKLDEDLENVLKTTSELERFHIFSGSIGLSTHSVTIHSLGT